MSGYVKIFSEIVESSIWDEPPETCKVWITLLALCDQDGYIRGSPGWLAGKARVPIEACREALNKFMAPDPSSRTPDNDGRRIEMLEDGWLVLNYLNFRDRLSADPKAVATRERVRKHRERYNALRNAESVTSAASASLSASSSASSKRGDARGECRIPSWNEWWGICQMAGLPEWKARDEFERQETKDDPWKGARGNLGLHASRVKKWWDADGRPMKAPSKINPNGSKPSIVSQDIARGLREIQNFDTTIPE